MGSLCNFYKSIPWIDSTAIDISPRDPSVIKMDFFDYDSSESQGGNLFGSLPRNGL